MKIFLSSCCYSLIKKPVNFFVVQLFLITILCNFFTNVRSQIPAVLYEPSKENLRNQVINRQIKENSHLTLVCPEVEKDLRVEWFKNEDILNSSFRYNMDYGIEEPHVTIDAYNSLYILHATKREEATYTCVVNGEIIQKYKIKIVSQSRLLNEDFIRFSMYLAFVLSLTLSCYCAGMWFAWHRRASFADPLNLYKQKP